MRTAEEAEQIILGVECDHRRRFLDALEAQGHIQATLDAYSAFLDNERQFSSDQVDALRGTPEGDALADTIFSIRAVRQLTKPTPAGGWRRTARWFAMAVAVIGGVVAARAYSFPLGSAFAAAVGIAAATIINRTWLGGRPERRHALDAVLAPRSQRLFKLLGKRVGPSPTEASLRRIEGEVAATQ